MHERDVWVASPVVGLPGRSSHLRAVPDTVAWGHRRCSASCTHRRNHEPLRAAEPHGAAAGEVRPDRLTRPEMLDFAEAHGMEQRFDLRGYGRGNPRSTPSASAITSAMIAAAGRTSRTSPADCPA